MLSARLYIASPDKERLEALFFQEPLFSLAGDSSDGPTALGEIRLLMPDFVLLDSALSGLDGYALLRHLGEMAAPPRVLFLNRMREKKWTDLAIERGADGVVSWPEDRQTLLLCAAEIARLSQPALAAPLAETRLAIAERYLTQLQVPCGLKGRRYMREAAALAACAPWLMQSLSAQIYPLLAQRFATTPQAVERAIRTAVEHTWLRGDLSAIQALFGFSVDADRGKPTNAEFIAMLTEHVRRETARILSRGEASRAFP